MFRAKIAFRPISDENILEVSRIFKLQADGVEIQPKDLFLDKIKTLTLNYRGATFGDFGDQTKFGSTIINVSDIVYVDLEEI